MRLDGWGKGARWGGWGCGGGEEVKFKGIFVLSNYVFNLNYTSYMGSLLIKGFHLTPKHNSPFNATKKCMHFARVFFLIIIFKRKNTNLNFELLGFYQLYLELKKFYFKYMYFHFSNTYTLTTIVTLKIKKINSCYK